MYKLLGQAGVEHTTVSVQAPEHGFPPKAGWEQFRFLVLGWLPHVGQADQLPQGSQEPSTEKF